MIECKRRIISTVGEPSLYTIWQFGYNRRRERTIRVRCMSYSVDDTQPRSPFEGDPINLTPTIRPEDSAARGSCLVTLLVIAMMLGFALVIVALAGLAGWTSGQRVASTNATATQNYAIGDQVDHLPTDMAAQNLPIIKARLEWLETQSP